MTDHILPAADDRAAVDWDSEEETPEELLEQVQANAQALLIATVQFLHGRGIPIEEWASQIGSRFAMTWTDDDQEWDAAEFMEAMLINLRSLGARVVELDLDSERSAALTAGFPDPVLLNLFKVDPALVLQYQGSVRAIAEPRGIVWEWQAEGEQVRYTATRAPR